MSLTTDPGSPATSAIWLNFDPSYFKSPLFVPIQIFPCLSSFITLTIEDVLEIEWKVLRSKDLNVFPLNY